MSDLTNRAWTFTLNNWTDADWCKAAMALPNVSTHGVTYGVIGKEIGESGTPHLQGFLYFKTEKSLKQMKKIYDRAHWEIKYKKSTFNDASNYCKKGQQSKAEWEELKDKGPNFGKNADFLEFGKRPMDQKDKGEEGKQSIQERWELAKAGKFEELPPEMLRTYEHIHRKYAPRPKDRARLDNLWIYGGSGKGKSRWVRENFPVFYTKMMNKWWDGYEGEEVVVLDDFDPSHAAAFCYLLKIWTDHYVFRAEIKSTSEMIRPQIFIITSQYTIEQCFPKDAGNEAFDAISRRFIQIDIESVKKDSTIDSFLASH